MSDGRFTATRYILDKEHHLVEQEKRDLTGQINSALGRRSQMILRKTFRFEASHVLPKHPGKCSRLHGHSWVLHIFVQGVIDSDTGFVMDYGIISERIKPIIDSLDHYHLNDIIPYPSSEYIVMHIATRLDQYNFPWYKIALEETCTSYCEITRVEYLTTREKT